MTITRVTWNREAKKIEVWDTVDGQTFVLRETHAEETVSHEVRNSLPASPIEPKRNWLTSIQVIELIKNVYEWLRAIWK